MNIVISLLSPIAERLGPYPQYSDLPIKNPNSTSDYREDEDVEEEHKLTPVYSILLNIAFQRHHRKTKYIFKPTGSPRDADDGEEGGTGCEWFTGAPDALWLWLSLL
jgi:hypothetical protein